MEEPKQFKMKSRGGKMLSDFELRILMGVSGQYIQKIRNEIASEQDLFCPYNPTLIDSEAVLKRYGLDKKLRMLEIKRKIKENEQNEN